MEEGPNVAERVRAAVVQALHLSVDPSELDPSEPLFDAGLAGDSIAVLEVLYALEREFGIEVADEDLRSDVFSSVDSLVQLVQAALDASPAP